MKSARYSLWTLICILSLVLAGCGSGSDSGGTVSGQAQKGPYLAGATVTVYQLDTQMQRTGTSATGETDATGFFSIPVSWEGPSEVEVDGTYFDERTGLASATAARLKCYGNVAGNTRININVMCHLSGERAGQRQLDSLSDGFDAAVNDAQDDVNGFFGLPVDTPLHELDLVDGSGEHAGANAALLALSTSILIAAENNPLLTVGDVLDALEQDIADDAIMNDNSDSWNGVASAANSLDLTTDVHMPDHAIDPPSHDDLGDVYIEGIPWAAPPEPVTVGGTVSGLHGSLVLRNNGEDELTVSESGNFTFEGTVDVGNAYSVTVFTHPEGQACSVTDGSGTTGFDDVTDVAVACVTDTYTVGGTVSGLQGTVVIQNNSGNNLSITENGAFTFTTSVPYGMAYNVTVLTQPDIPCSVANGSGHIGTQNVTNVQVLCELQLFAADAGTNGWELWKTDGTANGTAMIKDINPGTGSGADPWFDYYRFTNYGHRRLQMTSHDVAYFRGHATGTGDELWKTDGTANGTVLVKDINPGTAYGYPDRFYEYNGVVYFSANNGTNGSELWITDGTADGTVMVKDIHPGTNSSSPWGFYGHNGEVYFRANNGTNGSELWKTDGTANGTVMVKEIAAGNQGSSPYWFTEAGGTLYFLAWTSTTGTELWKTDGTANGTVMVKDIYPGTSSSAAYLTEFNDLLYLRAGDGVNGYELWKSDGTTNGTVMVKDINPGSQSGYPDNITVFNGAMYFRATSASEGVELWKSDGTANGTVLVKDIYSGTNGSHPQYFVQAGSNLFFRANNGTNGYELWKTDGTAIGTMMIKDINTGTSGSNPINMYPFGDKLYFGAYELNFGREPFISDGTANGTFRLKDIRSGSSSGIWDESFI